ncbi:MAG: efflux RND transporter periplasmic adaptor subunit [Polyangiaceae bacterium]|nr:efflux RND transporter periplasmic adaptor subunit [Polyangiaceae bacterium]
MKLGRISISFVVAGAGILSAMLGRGIDAHAHGGEDHGAAPRQTAEDPSAPRIPIETQFLLGLRTERAKRSAISATAGQVRTVIARPTGQLAVVAPFSGRVLPPEGGFVRLGEEVKKGQMLGTLRQSIGGTEGAQLTLARTDAASRATAAEARFKLAEGELARLKKLTGVVAEKDVAAAESEVAVAKAELQRAKADLGALSGGVGVQTLSSNIAGTVVVAKAAAGEQVSEGTELFRIVDLSTLWVEVRVPEGDITRTLGERAQMALVTDTSMRFEGRRVAVSSLVDPATRTVQVIFEVDNKDRRLRVGALVDVAMSQGAAVESVVIPSQALLDRNGQPVVAVKTGPETFEVRPVAVGPRAAGSVGIASGIRPGERVVVEGAMTVLMAAGG